MHRPLRTGGARAAQLPESRLDEVHGGQDAPRNAEASLRFVIPAQEISGRRGRADVNGACAQRRDEAHELAMRDDGVAGESGQLGRQQPQRSVSKLFVPRKKPEEPLLVQRMQGDVVRHPWSPRCTPRVDRLPERARRVDQCARCRPRRRR